MIRKAEAHYKNMSAEAIEGLTNTIIAGLPEANQGFGLEEFKAAIEKYEGID